MDIFLFLGSDAAAAVAVDGGTNGTALTCLDILDPIAIFINAKQYLKFLKMMKINVTFKFNASRGFSKYCKSEVSEGAVHWSF